MQLKTARIGMGYTQDQAADLLDVSTQTVRNWEAGRTFPDANNQDKVSELYQLPLDGLPGFLEVLLDSLLDEPEPRQVNPRRLRDARTRAGLSQKQAAESIGVARNTLTRYENGTSTPSREIVDQLAVLYARPAEWFYDQPPA